jgi:aminoglycoside phosphotransferase (APT) family kinase protein
MKMHDGELDIGAELVRRLVAAQFPRLAGLPIRAVQPAGTVNAIYRIGDDLCTRLPRVRTYADDLEDEWRWLPWLAPRLPLRIPEPVAKGRPASGYPFPWAIYRWISGQPYADELIGDERQAARDLARFVAELRRIDPAAAWERALEAPAWEGTPVWLHGDLLRPNLLVGGGRLCAVIDFGSTGVGDPAADVVAAWSVFGRSGRATFRRALGVADGTWNRARGYALHQAALIIPYYPETNPGFVALAKRTVEEVLADIDA